MFEIKPIVGFNGYFISNTGIVFSTLYKGCRQDMERHMESVVAKPIKARKTKNGYSRVYMRYSKTNKRKDMYIHRLVALAFIPNPNLLPEVNHKDSNPANNDVSNLEWCTRKYNLEYGYNFGYKYRESNGKFGKRQDKNLIKSMV